MRIPCGAGSPCNACMPHTPQRWKHLQYLQAHPLRRWKDMQRLQVDPLLHRMRLQPLQEAPERAWPHTDPALPLPAGQTGPPSLRLASAGMSELRAGSQTNKSLNSLVPNAGWRNVRCGWTTYGVGRGPAFRLFTPEWCCPPMKLGPQSEPWIGIRRHRTGSRPQAHPSIVELR